MPDKRLVIWTVEVARKTSQSTTSAASFRIADILIMMEDEPRPRASRDTRHALTVALVKPGRGACCSQAMNSSSAVLYTRFVIGDETLSSTSCFNFCQQAIFQPLPIVHLGSFNGQCVMWTVPLPICRSGGETRFSCVLSSALCRLNKSSRYSSQNVTDSIELLKFSDKG